VNGLCLDTSALLAYASGTSIEPGALIVLAEEDPDQQIWVPALCLGQAQLQLANQAAAHMLDILLNGEHDINVAVFDASTSRRVSLIAAAHSITLDVAHAITTAALYRCYLVTADRKSLGAAAPPGLDILDISEAWD